MVFQCKLPSFHLHLLLPPYILYNQRLKLSCVCTLACHWVTVQSLFHLQQKAHLNYSLLVLAE